MGMMVGYMIAVTDGVGNFSRFELP